MFWSPLAGSAQLRLVRRDRDAAGPRVDGASPESVTTVKPPVPMSVASTRLTSPALAGKAQRPARIDVELRRRGRRHHAEQARTGDHAHRGRRAGDALPATAGPLAPQYA